MRECHPNGVQGRRPINHHKNERKQARIANLKQALRTDFKK